MYTRLYFVLLIWLLYTLTPLCAQFTELGNEWYTDRANQSFIKMTLAEDGWYEVNFSDLLSAGHDLSGVDPDHLHLYYRGEELPLRIWKNGNALEKLGFWGMRNDGMFDREMYRDPITGQADPTVQPNIHVSLFTDTSAYYLTWGQYPGLRYQVVSDTTFSNYVPEPSFRYTAEAWHHPSDPLNGYVLSPSFPLSGFSEYVLGGGGQFDTFFTLNSDYVTGEGYQGPRFSLNDPFTLALETPSPYPIQPNILLKARVFHRSNTHHDLEIKVNNQGILDTSITQSLLKQITYQSTFTQTLSFQTYIQFLANQSPIDNNHLTWLELTYDRSCALDALPFLKWKVPSNSQKQYFQFTGVQTGGTGWIIDPGDNRMLEAAIAHDSVHVLIPADTLDRTLYLVTDSVIQKPSIQPQHHLSNLSDTSHDGAFLIITHRSLDSIAQEYAAYRSNFYSTKVVYTDEIYEEFGYGSLTPWAIKRFVNTALTNWNIPPQYVLLLGKGFGASYKSTLPDSLAYENLPMVPTWGYPYSDWEYVRGFEYERINPRVAIGRIPVKTNEEGRAYLQKLTYYESSPFESWRERALFLGGGNTQGEQDIIRDILERCKNVYPYDTTYSYFKNDSFYLITPSHLLYDSLISKGLGMITAFSQSIFQVYDLPVLLPEEHANIHKPLFLLMLGNYGISDYWHYSILEYWVEIPQKGSIGVLGCSGPAYLSPLKNYAAVYFEEQFEKMLGQSIGQIIQSTIVHYSDSFETTIYRNHARQLNYFGDPAVTIFRAPVSNRTLYPGDTDKDGVANVADLLPIGLAYGDTGTTRNGATLDWIVQEAPDWSAQFPDGRSHSYADVDGNGIVEGIDTLGIRLNYSRTSDKTQSSNFTQ
ncbi:MAG: C25 family cysteine peptidase, partial [Bacteroidota bacterium]